MFPEKSVSIEQIFGNNVKACREAKSLTQKELAEEILGIPEELLHQIEDGICVHCSLHVYVELANFFHGPLESLLTSRYFSPLE